MSFYIRKSLRAGPVRFNFSKSGVGVSVGITGFRIGTGPRGNYVHIGRKGLYYRATRGGKSAKSKPDSREEVLHPQITRTQLRRIESADNLELRDSSSADLLDEINNRHKKLRLRFITAALSLMVLASLVLVNTQGWILLVALPLVVICTLVAHRRDQLAKTVVLFYELDDDAESAYQSLHDAFQELVRSSRVWHIEAAGAVRNLHEWKRQAGASTLVQRKRIHLAFKAPPYVSTNLSIPIIPVGRRSLYFFPDRILVYEKGRVGAVSYADARLEIGNTRFIEAQGVPSDAQVVDYTWQYVNKDGSPDRRFKNNRRLPVVLYSELFYTSSTGLNELIQVSRPDVGMSLADSFKRMNSIQSGSVEERGGARRISETQVLREAKQAIQRGEKATCRQLLDQIIKANPNNETAWLWLSAIVDDPGEERKCLERVLELNPDNEVAQRHLKKLK